MGGRSIHVCVQGRGGGGAEVGGAEEGGLEPCLSCGRADQPERLHTHTSQHKSPLKVTHNPSLVSCLYILLICVKLATLV